VFVGTTGVFVIGYALAVLSILGTAKVAVALLVLGVPIIDTFWIIVRRLASGTSPFAPDRGHFHHRLLDLGLSHRGAVLVIYGICALLAVLCFTLSGSGQLYAFLGALVGGGLLLYMLTMRSGEALEARTYEASGEGGQCPPAEPQ
jgi:UDP-GlcNAc:undecaprenyl-phosphate GlcNAc-1-phosphate transferase